jgi:hypothetical protein
MECGDRGICIGIRNNVHYSGIIQTSRAAFRGRAAHDLDINNIHDNDFNSDSVEEEIDEVMLGYPPDESIVQDDAERETSV